jgi:MFS family permease
MVDLRLLGDRLFRTANLVSLFSSAAFLGVLFVGPLFLQEGLGVSPLTSGLTTFPEALGVVTSNQVVARLYPRIGPRRLMAAGLIGVAVVMALMGLLGRDTNLWFMRLLMFLTGAGMAYVFVPGQTATFATISSAAIGRSSALSNALRQLGSALGVGVLGEVLSIVGPTRLSATRMVQPNLTAYHAPFLAAAMLALVAAGIALAISDRDAAATMRPRVRQTAQEPTPEHALRVEAGAQRAVRRETRESGGRTYG